MLFLDYLNEWVQVHKASIQPATFISYNRMITGRITQYFEPLGLKLCEVTPQVLDEFQEKILLEGYTTNTVIHYHAIFGKAFKDAVRKDYLETNPMLKVDRPKKNSFRPNFYSKDEVQQLLEVSQDDPLHLCILITAYYGLRRSEVLGLKWSSIDFERKSITINHKVTEQLVNGKYVPVVSDVMKNKTSCRTLPLIPAVEEELLKQKEKQQLYRKLFKKSYSTEYLDFVCTDQEGKLIRPNFVTEHFDWLLTKYGLKHIRFHDLRQPDGDERRIYEAGSGMAGSQRLLHHRQYLRPPRLRFQALVCTGDAGGAGLWQCVSMMPYAHKTGWTGDVPAKKNGQTNKIHLSIRFGGASGSRTLAPVSRPIAFRVRPLTTT